MGTVAFKRKEVWLDRRGVSFVSGADGELIKTVINVGIFHVPGFNLMLYTFQIHLHRMPLEVSIIMVSISQTGRALGSGSRA